jgi:hydrogenase-1 operon protein HyaF
MRPEGSASGLKSIAVAIEVDTGNVPLLLQELRHALQRLIEHGATHVIDLLAIPLGPGEEDRLLARLGTGEIVAVLEAQGRSEIRECGYPGIWCISHFNPSGELAARFLEVTLAPALLSSPIEDVRDGLQRLSLTLDRLAAGSTAGRPS